MINISENTANSIIKLLTRFNNNFFEDKKMKTTVMTSIHVFPECDIDMRVNKNSYNNKKYAVLDLGDASIFINDHEKALEIASLLVQAAQELGEEDELDRLCMSDSVLGELQGAVNAVKELDK